MQYFCYGAVHSNSYPMALKKMIVVVSNINKCEGYLFHHMVTRLRVLKYLTYKIYWPLLTLFLLYQNHGYGLDRDRMIDNQHLSGVWFQQNGRCH